MTVRMWYQTMTDIASYPRYREAIETHAAAILDDGTTIDVNGVAPGTYGGRPPVAVLRYPYAYHVLLDQVLANVQRAEREGYDAVCLGSYSEPFLREARCAVDIPVVSMAESTLLVACSVAAKAALVTVTDDIVWMAERIVAKHHLEARVASIRAVEPAVDEEELLAFFDAPEEFLELFTRTARAAIADRADVVIPAEGVLSELVFAHGLREIDGVSVMDCVGVTILYGELMAKLFARTGLRPGRRWEYPLATPDVRALLADHAAATPLSGAG